MFVSVCIAAIAMMCTMSPDSRPNLKCDAARMYSMIEVLASDSLEGRRAESGNDLRAAHYLAGEMAGAGCRALWNDDMIVPFNTKAGGISMSKGQRKWMRRVLDGEWSDSSCNVVAVIRSGHPNAEKVLLGAHFDHLGRCKARNDGMWRVGDMMLGANDNASGTAAVVEIARLLQPYAKSFKRDLVVALFGAEEMCVVGSKHLEGMLRDSSLVVAHMVNLDMLGRMRGDTLVLHGDALAPLDDLVERTPCPDSLRVCSVPDRFSIGSDHLSFALGMIPVSFFSTSDRSTLHLPTDTPESLDMRGMERAVDYVAAYVYELLTADKLPVWSPRAEFTFE